RVPADGPIVSVADAAVEPLAQTLSAAGVTLTPLFGPSEGRVQAMVAATAAASPYPDLTPPDLSLFFTGEAPDEQMEAVAERLRALEVIDAAFIRPAPEPPVAPDQAAVADAGVGPPATPDFTPQQGYLQVAPGGIDALFAHGQPGGRGGGVRIIDVEGAWRFTHEDLTQNQGGVVGGTPSGDINWRNHGT